jgi:uncharacterized protein YutE (UPF0331/DUF86 family)
MLILGKKGIIPQDLAAKLSNAASFRNILIHEYLKVDIKQVYTSLQKDLDDFVVFSRFIAGYLGENH